MSKTEKLKIGIAGYGVVGKRRRLFLDKNLHVKTIGISDASFTDEGVTPDGISYFADFRNLLELKLDVLFVCLPNYLAPEATISGLERGLHVFCEKPPGCTVKDIQNVRKVEKKFPGLKLKYGFNHRYHDSVIEAKRIIESREFGKVISLRGVYGKSSIIPFSGGWRSERRLAGGGILLDQGIHMLDMIRYFAGDFDEIKSFVSNEYWHHDVEDNAYIMMRNNSGCVAMLHSTATQWQHKFRLEVTLEEALIELTGILSGSKSYGEERIKVVPRKAGSINGAFVERTTSYLDDFSWRDEINEFIDLIVQDKAVENGNSYDSLQVMKLVYNIYCADQSWREKFSISQPNDNEDS